MSCICICALTLCAGPIVVVSKYSNDGVGVYITGARQRPRRRGKRTRADLRRPTLACHLSPSPGSSSLACAEPVLVLPFLWSPTLRHGTVSRFVSRKPKKTYLQTWTTPTTLTSRTVSTPRFRGYAAVASEPPLYYHHPQAHHTRFCLIDELFQTWQIHVVFRPNRYSPPFTFSLSQQFSICPDFSPNYGLRFYGRLSPSIPHS